MLNCFRKSGAWTKKGVDCGKLPKKVVKKMYTGRWYVKWNYITMWKKYTWFWNLYRSYIMNAKKLAAHKGYSKAKYQGWLKKANLYKTYAMRIKGALKFKHKPAQKKVIRKITVHVKKMAKRHVKNRVHK